MSDIILAETRGAWRKLILNQPDKLNAFNAAMHAAFAAALADAAEDPDCRALLITGAGRGFCAGQELGPAVLPTEAGPPDLAPVVADYNAMVRRIRALPMPVIAAVNGVAAGAGANLALACDIVMAAKSAKFIQAFARIGLVPDTGGTFFLPRLVGEARARALAMTGDPVGAEQAESWGMIWRAVEDDALMPQAEGLAAKLAAQPTQAFALMKRAFDASASNTLDAQLDLEAALQRDAGFSPDYTEGVRAFLEKRPPRFTGGRA
jgi:2-(1,2-epoxy-1,2-dihydrophenyl)acetyl-CoA isomerase